MTMTSNEIYTLLQSDDATLAFDTSVTVRGGFLQLCEQVNRINAKRKTVGITLYVKLHVPAVAHTERLFDLAQKKQEKFDIDWLREILGERQIEIPAFTVEDAERCAELLMRRYKTPEAWYAFKKRRCLECVGLPADHSVKGSGRKCGAPNDWLIIAQASQEKTILVMDDKGRSGEFDRVENMALYDDVREAVEQILDSLTPRSEYISESN